jgi:diguanylate cyclase (GGDEF)-like protein
MPPDGEPCGITISCGVSSYPESFDGLESWHGLVERADQALYQAKAAGRNRVVAYAAADPVSVEQLAGG